MMSKCQVCDTEGQTFVCCSALGPVSFAYCRICYARLAEPIDMVTSIIEDCGGLENIRQEIKDTTTFFKDGKYILMKDWKP
jgi:hypothetical protein